MSNSTFVNLPKPDAYTDALYENCAASAEALHHHLHTENELLFAGLGGHLIADNTNRKQKDALYNAYTHATDVLAHAIREGSVGSNALIARTLGAAQALHNSLRTNNFLIKQEEEKHRVRIEMIMRRVALADLTELVDVHGDLPMHLLADDLYVTH